MHNGSPGRTLLLTKFGCFLHLSERPLLELALFFLMQMSTRAFGGVRALAPSVRPAPVKAFSSRMPVVKVQAAERLRMDNLSPPKGSRRQEKRKGRGYGAGQVCSGAFFRGVATISISSKTAN